MEIYQCGGRLHAIDAAEVIDVYQSDVLLWRFDLKGLKSGPPSASTEPKFALHSTSAPQRLCHDPAVFYPLAYRRRGGQWLLLRLGVELQAYMRSGCVSGRVASSVCSP